MRACYGNPDRDDSQQDRVMLETSHREWLQLATEKLSRADRNKRLSALDDQSVQLLELLERKWKLEAEAEPANP